MEILCILQSLVLFLVFSIVIFYYSAYLFDKDSLSSGVIALISALFVLIIYSLFNEKYKKFTNKSSLEKVDEIIKKIEPYADLRDAFKKSYERGYLLEYEEKSLLQEVSARKTQQNKTHLTQNIQSTLKNW